MAFRQQHGFDLTRHQIWYLENHELCVHTMALGGGTWRAANRSIGRLFQLYCGKKDSFQQAAEVWSRRSGKYVGKDLVFVLYDDRGDWRIAIFRYRADITLALKEALVAEVMES